jgi:TIGR03009 family protein
MRSIWPGLPALLILPALTLGQQPAPPAQPGPTKEQMLDAVLKNWEAAMTKLDGFSATCVRTTTDKTFGTTDVYEGYAKFLKSSQGLPSRALLYMEKKKQPDKYEKLLYTGTYLYEFVPATKVLRVYDVPQKNGQAVVDDSVLSLLFGQMKAADAKARYQMTWVPDPKDNNKYYHYIQILPVTPADKADFTEARLVLMSKDFMPKQVWYHQPNGNEIQWDFPTIDVNTKIPPQTFAPPQQLPTKEWRVERVQQPPAGGGPAAAKKN